MLFIWQKKFDKDYFSYLFYLYYLKFEKILKLVFILFNNIIIAFQKIIQQIKNEFCNSNFMGIKIWIRKLIKLNQKFE